MKTLSKDELKKLRSEGAIVRKKASAPKAAPKAEPKPRAAAKPSAPAKQDDGQAKAIMALAQSQATASEKQAAAVEGLANRLSQGQMSLVEKITTVLLENQSKTKPIRYRFTIERDRRGLIESVDAEPILES